MPGVGPVGGSPGSPSGGGGSFLGSGPLVAVLVTAIGGLVVFLFAMPRRRERDETEPAPATGPAVAVIPAAAPLAAKRAPALANVPTLEDESVARWMRPSPDEEPEFKPKNPGSGTSAMKRRSQPRPRTTRDLQAGS